MLLATIVLTCTILFACDVDNVKEISITPDTINVRIGEFNYSDYTVTVTYDSGKTEAYTLSEDMLSAEDRMKLFKEGEYEVNVNCKDKTTTIKVNVRRNVFAGAEFNDLDVVYNGEFYTVEVKNVPEGTTVTYPTTNRFRTAGTYQATAILRKDAYEMKEMVANVTIRKADYDLSQVTFEDKEEPYNGEDHELAIEGTLPTGLYVDYTITKLSGREERGNTAKNAGIYTVQATFSGDTVNYNVIEPKQATLTIKQAKIDVSAIKFEDKTVQYDRTMQKIEAEGTLPLGVTVAYVNNEHVDAGVYNATAVFSIDDIVNYETIPNMYAKLTIEKANYDMSGVHFNGTKVEYDGQSKAIEIEGQLPMGVSVSYTNNTATDAGSYDAKAVFVSNNSNYNNPESMTATLIIDPAPAPMGQISFERRRFISQKSRKDDTSQEEWDRYLQSQEEDPSSDYSSILKMYYYDPYLAANEYLPANIPDGFSISSVKFKKVDGWIDDLSSYNGEGEGYIDKIVEDGYYVIVVNFDGGGNYTGVTSVSTLIRANTINSFSNWELKVYDEEWRNPDTGEVSGAFMDYHVGACVEFADRQSITIGDITILSCDCNVFLGYSEDGAEALISKDEAYISEDKQDAFNILAEKYVDFAKNTEIDFTSGDPPEYYFNTDYDAFNSLLNAAYEAMLPIDGEDPTWTFDINKAAYIPLQDAYDYAVVSNYDEHTHSEYVEFLAHAFGFENVSDFFGYDRVTGSVLTSCLDMFDNSASGLSMESVAGKLACNGAIYDFNEQNNIDSVLMFPYVLRWTDGNEDWKGEVIIIFAARYDISEPGIIGTAVSFGALLSDAEAFMGLFSSSPEQEVVLEGRCLTTEVPIYKLSPTIKIVDENGVDVARVVTSGKDFTFIEQSDATLKLVYGNSDVYRFISDLPGNCAEEREGYNLNDYQIITDQVEYTYCDCDAFASVIKANGIATGITNRTDRDDHPQMEEEIFGKFDQLSIYFDAFMSNYPLGEDVVNEWKIGVTNRNYNSYKAFFEYARDLMATSKRNLGKNNDYVLSESALIGMNKAFTLSINNSGNDYTIDQYRLIVAKLFGFTDLTTFTSYTEALAHEISRNGARASTDSTSSRLVYDGAIYTENGYFVLPFVIKSELTRQKVIVLVFVDTNGNMIIWINDVRNAFNATSFGEEVLSASDKYLVTVYGRCLLFEDDGYIMKEDLDTNVLDMINNFQNFANNLFLATDAPISCSSTNEFPDEDEYNFCNDQAYYVYCDCDPFERVIASNGQTTTITKRVDRDDHAQMIAEFANRFDSLSALYYTFFSNYTINDNSVNDWKIGQGVAHYLDYRRLFNCAGDLFANSYNGLGNVDEYLLSESAIIGMSKSFVFSGVGSGNNYTTSQYREMVARLFGFPDLDALNIYTRALANVFVANERNANTDSIGNRLVYDGAIYTSNGIFVLPYVISRDAYNDYLLALIFIDTEGTMSIWISNVNVAFDIADFYGYGDENRAGIIISGRCVLFEENDYTGWMTSKKDKYPAVEKVKTLASAGDFLVYSPFTDEEGFEVYWFSIYGYELEVIYEDDNTNVIGTVQKGCYTFISVASIYDVRTANQNLIEEYEEGGGQW